MYNTSGDENHLCGASLHESHKIHHAHHWAGSYLRLQLHVTQSDSVACLSIGLIYV
jgi:hypothetical protein